ncbi:hypothetical protein L6164_028416 [Bauhinia variegata]|uniref:Uncharacterized protein n=1 Tax=Bauhinia variegata TaxID=167791 RepID=A0ACB9L631_BAUVA|nr:hypothetical protein L6164_028416 [Bauhinia variegata]
MSIPEECCVCNMEAETLMDALFKCIHNRAIWRIGDLSIDATQFQGLSFKQWLLSIASTWNDQKLSLFAVTAYKIRHQVVSAPQENFIKLNTDATYADNRNGGIGGVFRDSKGIFLVAWAGPVTYALSALVTEALAIKQGLQLLCAWGNKKVIKALQDRKPPLSHTGTILYEILAICEELDRVSFVWVPRDSNGLYEPHLSCWLDFPSNNS